MNLAKNQDMKQPKEQQGNTIIIHPNFINDMKILKSLMGKNATNTKHTTHTDEKENSFRQREKHIKKISIT